MPKARRMYRLICACVIDTEHTVGAIVSIHKQMGIDLGAALVPAGENFKESEMPSNLEPQSQVCEYDSLGCFVTSRAKSLLSYQWTFATPRKPVVQKLLHAALPIIA